MVSFTIRPHYPPGKISLIHYGRKVGWTPEPVWMPSPPPLLGRASPSPATAPIAPSRLPRQRLEGIIESKYEDMNRIQMSHERIPYQKSILIMVVDSKFVT